MSQDFFCSNWRNWNNLPALQTGPFFFFCQFVFKVLFSYIVTVLVLGFCKTVKPMATENCSGL
jgi:hypothetical protein